MTRGGIRKAMVMAAALSIVLGPAASAQSYSDGYKLLQAVEKKNREDFDALIAKNYTVINARDLSTGRSALHIAVDRRDVVWLVYLANEGANPNTADNKGVTPLMRASQIGFFEGVERLVTAGARVDTPNDAGETPLISATLRRDTQMMRALLRGGADPDRTDNSGRSARDYARLDGPGSTALAEIERSAQPGGRRSNAPVYGPGL